jgi:hypothetical protein
MSKSKFQNLVNISILMSALPAMNETKLQLNLSATPA